MADLLALFAAARPTASSHSYEAFNRFDSGDRLLDLRNLSWAKSYARL